MNQRTDKELAEDAAALGELAQQGHAARVAGFESLCLKCRQGHHGDACPRCWPPKMDDCDMQAIAYLRPADIYGWICQRLGALPERNPDFWRWLAVRDALDKAIRERGKP